MSQATAIRAQVRPVGRVAPRTVSAPRRLRAVSAPPQTRSRAGLVLVSIALLGSGLVTLLLLNVSLERGSYELQKQQTRANQLEDQAQALREQLAALQAPQNLAVRAERLGMVPNPNAAFLRASDGKVLGVPTQAVASRPPTVAPASGTGTAAGSSRKSVGKAGVTPGSTPEPRAAFVAGAQQGHPSSAPSR